MPALGTPPPTIFTEMNICVKAFDPETKSPIAEYKSYKQASVELGINANIISRRCHTKKRVFSPKLQKEIALRLAKMN